MNQRRRRVGSHSALRTVLVELGECLVAEFVEIAAVDRCSDIVEQLHEEVLVVDRRQRETVEFAGAQRVVHVCARIVRAGVAVAVLLKRTEIVLELRALDVVAAVTRENRTIAAATAGATQSKVSPPFSTQAKMSSTAAMPSTWRGRLSGIASQIQAQVSPMMRFSIAPPMPTPSKSSEAICSAACLRRSS